MNPQESFLELLIAAMKDAAIERKLTQLHTTIDPDGKGTKRVRIVIIPDALDHVWPKDSPLGGKTKQDGE